MSELPKDDNDLTTVFGTKNKTVNCTLGGITYTSSNTSSGNFALEANGLKISKKNQSISFVAPANSTVTIYLRDSETTKRMFDITSTGGLSLTHVSKNYTKPSTGAENVTVTNGYTIDDTTTDGNCIKLVIAISTQQTITISYSSDSTEENTVHIQQIKVSQTASQTFTISSIAADVLETANHKLSVTNAILGILNSTDTIDITSSDYEIYLDDVLYADGVLTPGSHNVVVKYKNGDYTQYSTTLNVPNYYITSSTEITYSQENSVFEGTDADKVILTGTALRNNNDGSAQFSADTELAFYVNADAKVTITGHSAQYGIFDIYINGVKQTSLEISSTGIYEFDVTNSGIIELKTSNYSNSYIRGIKVTYPVVLSNASLTFGSDGNHNSAPEGFNINCTHDNNGTDNCQVKNGTISFIVAAGSTLTINGYENYTNYSITGETDPITSTTYNHTYAAQTEVTITIADVNNYFYSIVISE